ncbi:putative NAD(P)-binding protein [Pedobacter psychrotolerans]|uniref:Putative NAD(P)-binding protein n=1 Tax=Pedobacter psychrotolerans TaxID=1843235 RepID=A0A4R2H6M2_9SPHI|nr:NAD(P)H-binding protein [Pedobacter psychrotolerans]TCO21513.1 putative NAD(P)-binding protein [Pedobacter psychrotolerans]GGE39182.1 hypothetical protein GCM10011413_00980 [Pedobacter psychrotolerans]
MKTPYYQLIENGYSIKIPLRNPETFEIKHPLVQIVKGDAIEFEKVSALIDGCQALISTIGQRPGEPLVAELATKNILKAMSNYGVKRYILVAGVNIDTPFDHKGPETIIATNWMKANFPIIQEDRQKAYRLLVESSVNFGNVRLSPSISSLFEKGLNCKFCIRCNCYLFF